MCSIVVIGKAYDFPTFMGADKLDRTALKLLEIYYFLHIKQLCLWNEKQ